MKIATYNVNGIRSRLPRLLEWLEETTPDVACLQELKCTDDVFPHAEIAAAGYGAAWHGQKGFNGVAILARDGEPKETARGLPGDPDDLHARYIEAEVAGVTIASLYLPNGNPAPGPKYDYKIAWMERLRAHAAGLYLSEKPVVLAGDYNVIPTDEDTFSVGAMAGDALTRPESRTAFRRLLASGWTDAIRARHPTGRHYTFWDYQAGAWARDAGFRIDHLLLSPAAADRLVDAGVDKATRGKEKASDHAPTWVVVA
ncbi:MAG: exodeoxyribonuclease III [Sphingomonas sp.]